MIAPGITQRWVRNASDELAAVNGCRFDAARGAYAVFWIERYCRLYEGDQAGEPMILRGCHQCENYGLAEAIEFDSWEDAQPTMMRRAALYEKCVAAGHAVDWQYECTMRVFSWIKWSERWKRDVRRFRQASIWVPKKNKKSPTLSAYGLYLTCGDGEQGGKTFFGAKDGSQARTIAGRHAIEMVMSSPELSAECEINKAEMQITHLPTRSILRPMASGDSRSQKSQEGKNGNLLIDETHVVDEAFIGRCSRMGISRSEPLQMEFSTAGDDPEGYGAKRVEYGRAVERGDITNEALFFAEYAAPQDLSDADLDADPLKFGRMANPAWNHTIGEEEFLADYQTSKVVPTELARFKMYRLNIWQQVAEAFIRKDYWKKCGRSFTEAEMQGQLCFAGLDLSKTTDMTALVLVFPRPNGCYRVLPWFWLPESRLQTGEAAILSSLRDWKAQGFLRTTPGEVCDYQAIAADIGEIHSRFRFQSYAFDPWGAEKFTQDLDREHYTNRVEFRQTISNFAGATGDAERLIADGKLEHNNHPVLTWQAGHTKVYTDANGNKRPIKPKHGDYRKIDGIVAMIMGLALALTGESGESIYSTSNRAGGLVSI